MANKVILGIDPGTQILGFGVVEATPLSPKYVAMGVVDLRKEKDHFAKIRKIFIEVTELIEHYKPDELAVEAPFYGKNIQSMLKLGRAQGVAMAASLHREVPITEYSPKKVKMAITGNGNASKEQVAGMLQNLLGLKEFPTKYLDASDGLAVAVCHHFNMGNVASDKNYTGWASFLKQNPDRIK